MKRWLKRHKTALISDAVLLATVAGLYLIHSHR